MAGGQKEENNFVNIKRQKNTAFYVIVILLVLLIIASSAVVILAWAKYQTGVNGTATAQVAKWSFKLVDGVPETSDVIDFAVTRTDTNTTVTEGKLAPGTYGQFEIGIDARGTETILEYVIDIALVNKPTNLKFYSDSERTKEIKVTGNKMTIKGFMSLEDVKEIRTEAIYWEWPYTIGTTETEIEKNDVIDTQDAGKTMTMSITVTGTEVLEEPIYLADVVQVGDYVNYNANDNGSYSYTTDSSLTGSTTASTFRSSDTMQWRVLSVDREKGKIELMSADPTAKTLTLSGQTGFVNGETVLNDIGAVYGHGKGAVGGRSIKLEDIEQYSSYDTAAFTNNGYGYKYGSTQTYTNESGTFYKEIKNEEGKVTGYETSATTPSSSSPVTMTQTFYEYEAQSYFANSTIYNMIFKKSTDTRTNKPTFWLASRSVSLTGSQCYFNVRIVYSGCVDYYYYNLCNSWGDNWSLARAVSAVVSLKSNIQTSGKDESGAWNLIVE